MRIPYLELGENEYIYRFRTAKERNRTIYIDAQSEALYQSALCSVIKAARRTREKSSGEPALLDFGAVRYVIPSHFGFCLGVQNAIERAYEAVAANPRRRVFMLSELIHNPRTRICWRGFALSADRQRAARARTAVLRPGRRITLHCGIS